MKDKFGISFPLKLVKFYFTTSYKNYFSEYIVVGKENIPQNCPIIFAPNHINALMDALAVHSITPRNLPATFLARSDLFNNNVVKKILGFLKILPAFRMRDGVEKLGRNIEIFEKCVEILHHHKALGIMPEGDQGEVKKLRQFAKGIFRIAFKAQEKYGTTNAVKIIPIGIDFGSLTNYGEHVIINIGKPIEISEYFSDYQENPTTTTNNIRRKLKLELSKITIDYGTNIYTDCYNTTLEVVCKKRVDKLNLPNNTIYQFIACQNITQQLNKLEKEDLNQLVQLDKYCSQYKSLQQKVKLNTSTLENPEKNFALLLLDAFVLTCTLPVFVVGFILNCLPFFTPHWIRKALNVEYSGFIMSINFALSLLTFPFFYVVQTILFTYFISNVWWIIIVFTLSQYFWGKYAFQWFKKASVIFSKLKMLSLLHTNNNELIKLQDLRKKIIQLIND